MIQQHDPAKRPIPRGEPEAPVSPSQHLVRSKLSLMAMTRPREHPDFADTVRRYPARYAAAAFVAGFLVGGWSWPRALAKAGLIRGVRNLAMNYLRGQVSRRR